MNRKMKLILSAALGMSMLLPSTVFAASDTGWIKHSNLYEVHTWTGKSDLGRDSGSLEESSFFHPRSVVALTDGSLVVSDSANHNLRMITSDKVTEYAGINLGVDDDQTPIGGLNDDVRAQAVFNRPSGLAVDSQGNIYIADTKNHVIRKLSKTGAVTTLAGNGSMGMDDGVGSAATFNEPADVAVDGKGNVYVADTLNHVIRKVAANGAVTTLNTPSTRIIEYYPGDVDVFGDFTEDGPIATAKFNEPSGLVIDAAGNLYVSDRGNQRIRYLDFNTGTVTTVAGGGAYSEQAPYVEGEYVDGAAAQARFNAPEGIALAADGSLIVADSLNHVIRIIKDGQVSTLAGVAVEPGNLNGVARSALFNHPTDVTILADGRLVIVDEYSNMIRVLQKYARPASLPTDQGINILYNGSLVPTGVPSQLIAGSVLLPLRNVGDALGYEVSYDEAKGIALLKKEDKVYEISRNAKTVTLTSALGSTETLHLNASTLVVNDRLFLPVRFFAEESGLDIQWDSSSKLVVIRDRNF